MISLDYREFEEAINAMTFVKRPSQVLDKDIATSVLIQYDGNGSLGVVGSNYQITISLTVGVISSTNHQAWELVVPFDILHSFFAGTPPEKNIIDIKETDDSLVIILVAGRRKMKIRGYSVSVYPFNSPFQEIHEYDNVFSISAYDLISGISFALSTTGNDDAPPVLSGVHFNRYAVHGTSSYYVDILGADGIRLTAAIMQPIGSVNTTDSFTLSMFGMKSVLRALSGIVGDLDNTEFDVYDSENAIIIIATNIIAVKVQKISGNFPDYRKAIPNFTASTTFTIALNSFSGLLKSAFAVSPYTELDVLKKLDIEGAGKGPGVLLTASNDNDATFQYVIPIDKVPTERHVVVDTKYLIATLSSFRSMGYSEITLEFSKDDAPIIVRPIASNKSKVSFSPLAILSPILFSGYVERKRKEKASYQL